MPSLMLPRSKLLSNRSGSPRNMHGNCFLIPVGGDMLTHSIRNSVIKTVTCHRSLSSNRKAHWNFIKVLQNLLDKLWMTIPTIPGSQCTAVTGSCSLKTARTQIPSLPLNFFSSTITLHALTCCLLLHGCSNQLMSFDSFISTLKRQSTGK